MKKFCLFIFLTTCCLNFLMAQPRIIPGAERMDVYVPLLKGKSVAVFANQTSMVGNTHLVDTLVKSGIKVIRIFGPEHGFRGTADAGEHVGNAIDKETGIEVVSLYGAHAKPTKEDLKGVDVMVFDLQDVGARFYTYINSMQYYLEASLENKIPMLLLDRPNPLGTYVDGPVLQPKFKSGVGVQPVPIVYGMTMGEYAMMIAGEKWLATAAANERYSYYKTAHNSPDTPFHFLVIKCKNYDHNSRYVLPVKPSPNLPEIQSIYWYPSTCFFEGTALNEGRGTEKPFQIFGHPTLPKNLYQFTPVSREGGREPKLKGQVCYGWNLYDTPGNVYKKVDNKIQLSWLINAYKLFPEKDKFFPTTAKNPQEADYFFNHLAGNATLMQQIKAGLSEKEIKKSWEPELNAFKKIRKKYLLYP